MIIGIDGNEANVQHQVGVSVYTTNLLRYFQQQADADTQFRIYLREEPKAFLPQETDYFKYRVIRGRFLWSQIFLPFHLNTKKEIDVFFTPAHYAPRYCPVPLVVTIHDLSYFYYPDEFLKKDLYKLQNWTKYSVEQSKKIIAVSKTTKKDIMKFYNIPDEKIEVVYNGFEKNVKKNDELRMTNDEKETKELSNETINQSNNILANYKLHTTHYILYVGTLQPRKNISLLIQAFAKFKTEYPEYKLVLTGRKGWLYDKIFKEVQDKQLQDAIIFTGYLSDEEVATLYQNAFCFVLPSLYEGFGIPILEAMSYDCPVITSHSSSLPEVGGDACLYFDAKDPHDLYNDLKLLIQDKNIKQELIQKGRERIKQFSWKTCAEQTLQILRDTVTHEVK
jgi:glycosyltransferase involved in cell wall biosynthesis